VSESGSTVVCDFVMRASIVSALSTLALNGWCWGQGRRAGGRGVSYHRSRVGAVPVVPDRVSILVTFFSSWPVFFFGQY
jgi:hypothetical protein